MNAMLISLAHGPAGGRWGGGWEGGWSDGGGWWWVTWPLSWLAFLALVGVGVWLIVRTVERGRPRPAGYAPSPTDSARRILAERFARGEIDEEEYRHRLAELA